MIKRIAVSIGSAALALLAAVSVQAQTYSNAVQALNPVAYWPLQETTTPAAGGLYIATNSGTLGAAGNGYYETWWQTNGNPGALTNGNVIVHIPGAIAGDPDTAMQEGAIGQYIVIPRATNGVYDPALTLTSPFTIETWIYPTNPAAGKLKPILTEGFNPIIATNLNYATTTEGVGLGMYGGVLYYVTFNGAGTKTEIDTPTLVLNQWHHIVATFDGTTETLYMDGATIGSKSPPVDSLGNRYEPDPVSPLIVGGGNELGISGGANVPFGGGIDEVAIYNSAFTQTQVTNHYETGTNPAPATPYVQVVQGDSPSIYLRLDEPAFTAPSLTSSPVANNYGSLGASANGFYLPGATPGIPGPAFSGFGTQSHAVAMDGFNSAVDIGGGALPSQLNPTNKQPMTIAAWFMGNPADSFDRYQIIVGHTDSSWRLGLDTIGGTHFNPGAGPELQFASVKDELSSGNFANDGNWHFIVGASDGTNDYMYLDGQLVKSGTSEPTVTTGSFQDLLLGGDPQYMVPQPPSPGIGGGGRWFDGNLTQVAFFTNALSAAQVQQLYNAADVPLSIAVEPVSATYGAGTNATLSAIVHGSSPAYQWYSTNINNGTVAQVAGQTSATLSFNPSTSSESGYYFLIANNNANSVTSSVAQLTIVGPPAIIQSSPTNIQVFAGTTPTLHVTVLAPLPGFQWYSNNVAIAGATNSTLVTNSSYTMTNGGTSSVGSSVYTCVVTNSFGRATNIFNVTVLADPTAPYPVQVLHDKPIYYYRMDEADTGYPNNGVIGYDYAGGENGSYSNANLGQPGYSSATEPSENSAGFGLSASADSYLGNMSSYVDFATPTNNNAEFSIEAWVSNGPFDQTSDGGIVAVGYGFGGEEFALDTGANDGGNPAHCVRFYVNTATGGNVGIPTTFSLYNNPGWHHLVAVCDEAGGKVSLYIDGYLVGSANIAAKSGIRTLTAPLAIGARLPNGTQNDYVNQFQGNIDDVAIYNYALTAAQVQSHYFSSGIAPIITQVTPLASTNNPGSSASFTVTAGGTQPLYYEWFDNNGNPITGQTNATLVLNNIQPSQAGTYTVSVNNIYGAAATTNVTLVVEQGPATIVTDLTPTDLVGLAGSTATYSIVAGGDTPLFYQWYKDGAAVSGATNSSYTFTVLLGTNTYYCSVTNSENGGSPAISSTGTVAGMPSTTLNPASYTDNMKITFSGYNLGDTLQAVPVLVRLSTNIPGFSYSHFASATGGDLRFTDSSGNVVIPSEIEQWNPSGESLVWVQVPKLTGSNDFIWAYWGNPSDTTAPSGTNVWVPAPWMTQPGYDLVYHLKETGFPYGDSTGVNPALTGNAPTQTTGLVGAGQSFANGSFLDVGSNYLTGQFTVSAWVNLDPSSTNIQAVWCNKIGGYNSAGFGLYINSWNTKDGAIHLETGDGVTTGQEVYTGGNQITPGSWHLLTAVIDVSNGVARLFVDTNMISSGAIHSDMPVTNDLRLAIFDDNSYPFDGVIDEARVQNGTNSASWITAQYMTVAQNSNLQSYSPVTSTIVSSSPVTIQFQSSGGNLILDGSAGAAMAGKQFTVLSSTNVAAPMAQWTTVTNDTFNSGGNFSNAVPISSTNKALFFRIVVP